MKPAITATLVAVFVGAHGLLGVVCGMVYRRYGALFAPGPELWALAGWVLGTVGLIAVATGLVVALVRPSWVIVAAFGLSALAMVVAWRITVASVALTLVYVVWALLCYARRVASELDSWLTISVHPVGEHQGRLLAALSLLLGVSFALGYREDAMRRSFVAPPALQNAVMGIVLPRLQAGIEGRSELDPQDKAAALEGARESFERSWADDQRRLQPYLLPITMALALVLAWVLKALLGLLSWAPLLLLTGVFLASERLGVRRTARG